MREQHTAIKRQRIEAKKRAAAIDRKASRLGIAPGVMSNRPGAVQGIEDMTTALRNLGLLASEHQIVEREKEQ
jgi:hypothetical protein